MSCLIAGLGILYEFLKFSQSQQGGHIFKDTKSPGLATSQKTITFILGEAGVE